MFFGECFEILFPAQPASSEHQCEYYLLTWLTQLTHGARARRVCSMPGHTTYAVVEYTEVRRGRSGDRCKSIFYYDVSYVFLNYAFETFVVPKIYK